MSHPTHSFPWLVKMGLAILMLDPLLQRQVRRLLAEGRITSYEKGELVVKLQEMEFPEEEALVAAEHCEDIYAATKFLQQECELCANVMNVTEVKIFIGSTNVSILG